MTYEKMKPSRDSSCSRGSIWRCIEIQGRAGYALVVAKVGLKLTPGKENGKGTYIMSNALLGSGLPLGTRATMLAIPVGKPVMDRTEVEGIYVVDLHCAPENYTDSTLPSLFTALEEQAGLKLESQRVPVEMLVLDHVEMQPTEN